LVIFLLDRRLYCESASLQVDTNQRLGELMINKKKRKEKKKETMLVWEI